MTASNEGRDDVAALRAALERVDEALVMHLAERVQLARRLGAAKRAGGVLTLDPAREMEVLRRVAARAREQRLPADEVREIFWRIIALCRDAQRADR